MSCGDIFDTIGIKEYEQSHAGVPFFPTVYSTISARNGPGGVHPPDSRGRSYFALGAQYPPLAFCRVARCPSAPLAGGADGGSLRARSRSGWDGVRIHSQPERTISPTDCVCTVGNPWVDGRKMPPRECRPADGRRALAACAKRRFRCAKLAFGSTCRRIGRLLDLCAGFLPANRMRSPATSTKLDFPSARSDWISGGTTAQTGGANAR
jgi:hypothetical protein